LLFRNELGIEDVLVEAHFVFVVDRNAEFVFHGGATGNIAPYFSAFGVAIVAPEILRLIPDLRTSASHGFQSNLVRRD